jgi:DNA-binding transcriptional MerR regulator
MERETTVRERPANATQAQGAAYLQLSRRTMQNLQDRGLLKPIYFGRRRFYRWSDLERLAKTGAQF